MYNSVTASSVYKTLKEREINGLMHSPNCVPFPYGRGASFPDDSGRGTRNGILKTTQHTTDNTIYTTDTSNRTNRYK